MHQTACHLLVPVLCIQFLTTSQFKTLLPSQKSHPQHHIGKGVLILLPHWGEIELGLMTLSC